MLAFRFLIEYFICLRFIDFPQVPEVQVPCHLETNKTVNLENSLPEATEVAKIRSERRLPRKYYKLKELEL